MNDQDKKDIAEMVADLLEDRQCPHGIDADTASALKEFATAWTSSKKTILKTVVTWLTLALIGAAAWGIAYGIAERLKH